MTIKQACIIELIPCTFLKNASAVKGVDCKLPHCLSDTSVLGRSSLSIGWGKGTWRFQTCWANDHTSWGPVQDETMSGIMHASKHDMHSFQHTSHVPHNTDHVKQHARYKRMSGIQWQWHSWSALYVLCIPKKTLQFNIQRRWCSTESSILDKFHWSAAPWTVYTPEISRTSHWLSAWCCLEGGL